MTTRFFRHFIQFVLVLSLALPVFPWGFSTHKQIARDAVTELPPGLVPFFKAYADSVVVHSVDPDLRRDAHPEESPRHYLDIDRYGSYPFEELPRSWEAAVEKFSVDTIKEYGTLPWWIARTTDSLSRAMQQGNAAEIIHWAAFLAHYVADAHQPLHTVLNYDGQLTGNDGIHSRYETGMLRIYMHEYQYTPIEVPPVEDLLDYAFHILLESYQLTDQIIVADDAAVRGMSRAAIRQLQEYWKTDRDSLYFARLYARVDEMTWEWLQKATARLAAFYTAAWENAGKPELPVPSE